MAYAGILAHGTSLTAAECARMIPQLSATSVRQAMRWAGDERRLRLACQAVLEYMQSHPTAATWGRADLASSDMMSLETSKRIWQARLDPRRQTASVGVYSHVRDRWGILHTPDAVRPSPRDDADAAAQQPPVKRSGPSKLIPLCAGSGAPARRT
jgi:TnpA family transposase